MPLNDCKRCGWCCEWFTIEMPADQPLDKECAEWMTARGMIQVSGYLLIPSPCPQLDYQGDLAVCTIQDHKPMACQLAVCKKPKND